MQQVLQTKLSQLRQLEQCHCKLAFKHNLLVAFCDSLHWLRQHHATTQQQQSRAQAPSLIECSLISRAEALLLDELCNLPYNDKPIEVLEQAAAMLYPDADEAVDSSSRNGNSGKVSPHDRLYVFRWLLAQPPIPGAESLELPQLLADYGQTVRELSLQLHLHKANMCRASSSDHNPFSCPQPLMKIKALILRHMRLVTCLYMADRGALLYATCLTSFETGHMLKEISMERYRLVVRQLGMNVEQQQQIMYGFEVFRSMLGPMQLLRQQQLGLLEDRSSTGSAMSSSSMLQHLTHPNQQQESLDCIRVLLKKEALITHGMGCFIFGCLSYEQLANAVVLMSPYGVAISPFAAAVGELLQEQQQAHTPAAAASTSS